MTQYLPVYGMKGLITVVRTGEWPNRMITVECTPNDCQRHDIPRNWLGVPINAVRLVTIKENMK